MLSRISIKEKLFLALIIVVSAICLTWLATSLTNNAFASVNEVMETPNVSINNDSLGDDPYKIDIQVRKFGEESQIPLPGYRLCLYDKNRFLVADVLTDNEGYAHFENLSEDIIGGFIFGRGQNRTDIFFAVDQYFFSDSRERSLATIVPPMENCNLICRSTSGLHSYFCEHLKSFLREQPLVDGTVYFDELRFYDTMLHQGTVFTIEEDGSVTVLSETVPFRRTWANYSAVSIDGSSVNHWRVDHGTNKVEDLYPGDTFTVEAEYSHIFMEPIYNEAPSPTPTPVDPTETAQTGDSSMPAVVALDILAASSAITLICSRKRRSLV